MLYRLQVSQSSLTESQRTASELGQKLQEIQLARSSAEQVNHHDHLFSGHYNLAQ